MMTKNFLIIFAVVTLTHAQGNGPSMDSNINVSRRQYDANLRDYDLQIASSQELFMGRLNTIDIQLEMLLTTVQQSHDALYPLERLSDLTKKCVNKYKSLLPTVAATEVQVLNCTTNADRQFDSLASVPQETRTNLKNYYENVFDMDIQNCKSNYSNMDLNYTACVTNAISSANMYTMGNQEKFALQMVATNMLAGIYVSEALQCSFKTQSETVSSMAEANTLIDRCLQGWDDCAKCNGYFCENVADILIDMKNETMVNPFYSRNATLQCLMLNVVS